MQEEPISRDLLSLPSVAYGSANNIMCNQVDDAKSEDSAFCDQQSTGDSSQNGSTTKQLASNGDSSHLTTPSSSQPSPGVAQIFNNTTMNGLSSSEAEVSSQIPFSMSSNSLYPSTNSASGLDNNFLDQMNPYLLHQHTLPVNNDYQSPLSRTELIHNDSLLNNKGIFHRTAEFDRDPFLNPFPTNNAWRPLRGNNMSVETRHSMPSPHKNLSNQSHQWPYVEQDRRSQHKWPNADVTGVGDHSYQACSLYSGDMENTWQPDQYSLMKKKPFSHGLPSKPGPGNSWDSCQGLASNGPQDMSLLSDIPGMNYPRHFGAPYHPCPPVSHQLGPGNNPLDSLRKHLEAPLRELMRSTSHHGMHAPQQATLNKTNNAPFRSLSSDSDPNGKMIASLLQPNCYSAANPMPLLPGSGPNLMKLSHASANGGPDEKYSRKVFVGGLPPDIDEEEITSAFRRFGPVVVDWPHKAESKSFFPPKGYCFLIFQEELPVQHLMESCVVDDGKAYWCVSSPTIRDKMVQIRPWCLADSDYVLDDTQPLDPRKTIFVGGVPRPLKASELAMIMNRLYGGVCYVGIDTDPDLKYPKGAGRVAFSNQQSYIAAISARFVQLQHKDIDKRVEVKPYVLDDQLCDECGGTRCGGKFAPYFCANVACLQYYCEQCWQHIHSRQGRQYHKPLVKEGADRPRTMAYRW